MENQNGISEGALMGGIDAIRMGYQRKPPAPSASVSSLPYTEHEIRDIFYIRDGLDFLMSEVKAGYPITKKMHGRLIHDILARNRALEEKERAGFGRKAGGETREDHTTSHYTWRTQGDGKVRPEHAVNDGKVFAWDDPPPTGHPGEAFGCRCWAEPYKEDTGDTEELRETRSQVVTYAAPDASLAWTWEDFTHHYFFGKGQSVTLDQIGHLQDIINCAKIYDQVAVGGGTIFDRVASQILEAARQKGEGSFSDYFQNGYEFRDFVWSLAGATVNAAFLANVAEKGDFLIVTADIEYTFTDMFTNPLDLPEDKGWDLPFSMPYPVVGTWSTYLEAIIRK